MSQAVFAEPSTATKKSDRNQGITLDEEVIPDGEEPIPGKVFAVKFVRRDVTDKLGICLYDGAPELTGIITEILENSLLKGTVVETFDRLLAINGRRVSEIDALQKVLKSQMSFQCLVRRPKTYAFKIRKEGSLGISLGFTNAEDRFLIIQGIQEGIIKELNSNYKDREVRRFDGIVSVNGEKGTAEHLVKLIEDSPKEHNNEITFGMLRWFSKSEIEELEEAIMGA